MKTMIHREQILKSYQKSDYIQDKTQSKKIWKFSPNPQAVPDPIFRIMIHPCRRVMEK